MRKNHGGLALVLGTTLLLSACGDGDDTAADPTTPPPTAAPASDDATEEASDDATEVDALAEYCGVAEEIAEADLPTADQMQRYKASAPAEISAEATIAADALIPHADDVVAFIATFAQDEVNEAVNRMNEYEVVNCGLDHDAEDPVPGTSFELDASATRVDVVATEFTFDVGEVAAGNTSFVLTSDGAQAHHLLIFSLPEGMTAEEAVQSEEDDNGVEEVAGTLLAAPGGEDEEVVTVDLAAGNYAFVCFLPDSDGTPHAFKGMAIDVTVA